MSMYLYIWYGTYYITSFFGGRDVDIIDLNYEKEWDVLFKNQTISGDYSKKVILGAI